MCSILSLAVNKIYSLVLVDKVMNWLELCTCARSFKFFHQRVVKYKIKAHFLGGSATTLQMIATQQPFYNIESAFMVHSNVQTILHAARS